MHVKKIQKIDELTPTKKGPERKKEMIQGLRYTKKKRK